MRVEEIAVRQEALQLLAEAGLTKEQLKNIVLDDIDNKVNTAIQKINELGKAIPCDIS